MTTFDPTLDLLDPTFDSFCDRCPATAQYLVFRSPSEQLQLCRHHTREHEVALVLDGWETVPMTEQARLESAPLFAATASALAPAAPAVADGAVDSEPAPAPAPGTDVSAPAPSPSPEIPPQRLVDRRPPLPPQTARPTDLPQYPASRPYPNDGSVL